MGSTFRENCDPSVGTFPNPNSVLNPLAKLIEETSGKPLYSCALEPRAYLKFVQLTPEQWNKVYGNVKYKKELVYTTEKDENDLENPRMLVEEAVAKWSDELQQIQGGKFGCIVDRKKNSHKLIYKLGCLFI
ncbi:hypothetical protein Y032_0067g115 [Ancylostoma ceylanicum]|nr:hypothetical protein Y032_0067g115 [Ancylostoma ceylanicum]